MFFSFSHEEYFPSAQLPENEDYTTEVLQYPEEGRFFNTKTFTLPRNNLAYQPTSRKSNSLPRNLDLLSQYRFNEEERFEQGRFNEDLSPQNYKSEYAKQYREFGPTHFYSSNEEHLNNSSPGFPSYISPVDQDETSHYRSKFQIKLANIKLVIAVP